MIVLTRTLLAGAALTGCLTAGALAAYILKLRRRLREAEEAGLRLSLASTAARAAGHAAGAAMGAPFAESPAALSTEEWLALPARTVDDPLFDWDIETDQLRFSARWRAMLGCPAEDVVRTSQEWFGRVHPADHDQLRTDILAQRLRPGSRFTSEHRVRHEDGRWLNVRWHGAMMRDVAGNVVRIAGSVRDVTAVQAAEEQLRRAAHHDALTDLPNRLWFLDVLRRAVARRARDPECRFAMLLVDCDRLKVVNDALGHAAGDELLRRVAARISAIVRPGDVVARLTGDEFVLLLEDIPHADEAVLVAARLQDLFARPFRVVDHDVVLTVSTGVVVACDVRMTAEEYLRDAGVAMHKAKSEGGARAVLFADAMREGAFRQMSIEHDLRRAIEHDELVVRYQPVWSTATRRLAGFEALVRWMHPTRGALSPREFIPIAEESGLIVPLGRWALFEACRQLRHWDDHVGAPQPLWMSVNLATKQLTDPSLIPSVVEVLRESGLSADRLKLEVTENTILSDEQAARATLDQLRDLGVRLMMDDFGTGHASLTYLHRLPLAAIKIDRYFVGRMHYDAECLEIVRSLVTLARSLNMESVAEGVDHVRQLEHLEVLGCRYVQGFLLGRPLAADEASDLVTRVADSRARQEAFDPRDHGFDGVESAIEWRASLGAVTAAVA